MSRSTRLLLLLRPYTPLFVVNLVTTVFASVLDGVTFVLLIPFLRTLFGQEALPTTGGSAVERLLATVVGPVLAASAPDAALRNVVLVLLATLVVKNALVYSAKLSRQLLTGLAARPRFRVWGITDPQRLAWRVPTVSLTLPGTSAEVLARRLAEVRPVVRVVVGHLAQHAAEPLGWRCRPEHGRHLLAACVA